MTDANRVRTGGCLCAAVRYELSAEPGQVAICHCRMCQRWGGGPFACAAEFAAGDVHWNEQPSLFRSSDALHRSFCPTCGSSLRFHSTKGTVWITLGSLDEPGQLAPQYHIFSDEEMPWAHLNDGLPRHGQFGPD